MTVNDAIKLIIAPDLVMCFGLITCLLTCSTLCTDSLVSLWLCRIICYFKLPYVVAELRKQPVVEAFKLHSATPSRPICGYTTSVGYRLSTSKYGGIGLCSFAGLLEVVHRCCVSPGITQLVALVRGETTQHRFVKLNLLYWVCFAVELLFSKLLVDLVVSVRSLFQLWKLEIIQFSKCRCHRRTSNVCELLCVVCGV